MKKILFVAITAIFLFSCEQSEFEFSCDPVINEIVTENREEFAIITIQEFVSYDIQLQRAIYNSWDYQKKRNTWIDKLEYVLIRISFSEAEEAHIQTLIDHIDPDYFLKENVEKDQKARTQFAAEWINYSINQLGWSNQFVAFMVYRLYTNQSQFDSELSVLKAIHSVTNTDSESGSCNCNSSADFCGGISCNSGECSVSFGCGWLWTMTCNGSCY